MTEAGRRGSQALQGVAGLGPAKHSRTAQADGARERPAERRGRARPRRRSAAAAVAAGVLAREVGEVVAKQIQARGAAGEADGVAAVEGGGGYDLLEGHLADWTAVLGHALENEVDAGFDLVSDGVVQPVFGWGALDKWKIGEPSECVRRGRDQALTGLDCPWTSPWRVGQISWRSRTF